jgi:hypothetical protein
MFLTQWINGLPVMKSALILLMLCARFLIFTEMITHFGSILSMLTLCGVCLLLRSTGTSPAFELTICCLLLHVPQLRVVSYALPALIGVGYIITVIEQGIPVIRRCVKN